jgi:hypothetical protein
MFSSPIAAGMITGIFGSALNILPQCCFNWNFYTHTWRILLFSLLGLNVICSGPQLVHVSARGIRKTFIFSILMTVLVAFLPFMAVIVGNYSFAVHYYELSALFGSLGAAFIGMHLATRYGIRGNHKSCALLAMTGNIPVIIFDLYYAWLWQSNMKTGFAISKDMLAFMIMAHLLSAMGIATLPAIAVESEYRKEAAKRVPAESKASAPIINPD